ncbi:cytoskeletal protein binding protein [Xylographa trunciseda]|nr:cytoskeletal protein binding protein [Xylographa trunciseda]
MDPISILTITQIACTISFQIISTLYSFANDVKDLDVRLRGFTDEVEGLRRILVAITTSLNDPQLRLAEISTGKYGNKDMWEAIHGSVEDCRLYLEKLRSELSVVGKKKGEGNILRQAIRALELRLNKDDINNLRSQVRSHQLGLNTALQMLNVLAPQIASLGEAMAKLQTSIDTQSSLQTQPLAVSTNADATSINTSVPDSASQTLAAASGSDSTRINSVNLLDSADEDNSIAQRLNEAAVKVHSNASIISNARSTVWGGSERVFTSGSEWGEPLSPTAHGNIEKWLSQPRTNDITEEDDESNLASGTLETSIFSQDKISSSRSKDTESDEFDSDAEGELEADIVQKLLTRANVRYEAGAYAEAEDIYRHALNRSKSISFTRKTMLNLKHVVYQLARACFQQKKLDDARKLLLDLVQECSLDSKHAYLILEASYVLAQIFVFEGDFENAEIHCKRTVVGRRRLLGKDAKETFAAIQLLVVIYSSEFAPKEVKYEAEVWRDMLPPQFREKDENTGRLPDVHDKEHSSSNGLSNTIPAVNSSRRPRVIPERYHFGSKGSNVMVHDVGASPWPLEGHFVSESVHDGDEFPPNTKIEQIWSLRNPGPSVWPAGCYVHFVRGDAMFEPGHERSDNVDHEVGVGEVVSFSVSVTVPELPGKALSHWRLCTAKGVDFGHRLWCDIMVTGSPGQGHIEEDAASGSRRKMPDRSNEITTEQIVQPYKADIPGDEVADTPKGLRVDQPATNPTVPEDMTQGYFQEVLYDYAAEASDELTVKQGETIVVLEILAEWSMVRRIRDKKEGLLPSSYFLPIATATSKKIRPIPDKSKLRVWTDVTGNFKVDAEFLGCKDGKIILHKMNGVKISVPLAKMSTTDLTYVEQMSDTFVEEDKHRRDFEDYFRGQRMNALAEAKIDPNASEAH